MKKIILYLIILFVISFPDPSSAEEATVTRVMDSNTVEINDTTRINLYGVSNSMFEEYEDFKENLEEKPFMEDYKKIKGPALYVDDVVSFDQQAAVAKIEKILLHTTIYLKEIEKGKYLLSFSPDDDNSINELLVAEGLASMDDQIKPEYKMRFLHAEKIAKDNKSGVWGISYQSESISDSKMIIGKRILIVLTVFILLNLVYLIISIKKLSKIPSWTGYFYGLFSLLAIPLPVLVLATPYKIVSMVYLGICLIIILMVLYILSKFILKHKEVLSINKLSALIIGSVVVVISYFTFVYAVFDDPREVHITQEEFFSGVTNVDDKEVIGDYIAVNEGKERYNSLDDYLYLSGTTFFGGSYGDVIPNGSLRFIVMLEMLISFLLQLLFFSMVINLIYDKFIRSKHIIDETSKQDEVNICEQVNHDSTVEEEPHKTETYDSLDRKTNNFYPILAACIVLLLEVLNGKKH